MKTFKETINDKGLKPVNESILLTIGLLGAGAAAALLGLSLAKTAKFQSDLKTSKALQDTIDKMMIRTNKKVVIELTDYLNKHHIVPNEVIDTDSRSRGQGRRGIWNDDDDQKESAFKELVFNAAAGYNNTSSHKYGSLEAALDAEVDEWVKDYPEPDRTTHANNLHKIVSKFRFR